MSFQPNGCHAGCRNCTRTHSHAFLPQYKNVAPFTIFYLGLHLSFICLRTEDSTAPTFWGEWLFKAFHCLGMLHENHEFCPRLCCFYMFLWLWPSMTYLRDIANSPIGCRMFAHGYKMLQDIAATYCNCIEYNNTSESCAKVISHIESVQILTWRGWLRCGNKLKNKQ